MKWLLTAAVSVALVSPAAAAKPGKEFKAEIDKTVRGQKYDRFRTYAVVLDGSIPVVSRFGQSREGAEPGFVTIDVDVVDGEVRYDRKAVEALAAFDVLRRGEVVGVGNVGYSNRSLDLNLVTLKGRLVTRTNEANSRQTSEAETMSVVLKFRFPAAIPDPPGPADAAAVLESVKPFLSFFPDVESARRHAAALPAPGR